MDLTRSLNSPSTLFQQLNYLIQWMLLMLQEFWAEKFSKNSQLIPVDKQNIFIFIIIQLKVQLASNPSTSKEGPPFAYNNLEPSARAYIYFFLSMAISMKNLHPLIIPTIGCVSDIICQLPGLLRIYKVNATPLVSQQR